MFFYFLENFLSPKQMFWSQTQEDNILLRMLSTFTAAVYHRENLSQAHTLKYCLLYQVLGKQEKGFYHLYTQIPLHICNASCFGFLFCFYRTMDSD